MKRAILILGVFLSLMPSLCAQEIITGTVIDDKNQPVPGARVEAVGRTEYGITDIDGIFRFEVPVTVSKVKVTYVGYKPLTKKVKPDMLVKLNKGWRSAPDEYQWFAGANLAMDNGDGDNQAQTSVGFGLMGGYVKSWGVYANTMFGLFEPSNKFVGFSVGGIRRLWCPLHLYLGIGYLHRSVAFWDRTTYYDKTNNFAINYGLLFRFGKFGINLGYTLLIPDDDFFSIQVGLNYFF